MRAVYGPPVTGIRAFEEIGERLEIAAVVSAGQRREATLIPQMGEVGIESRLQPGRGQPDSPLRERRSTRATSDPSWPRNTVPWSSW